MHSNSATPHCDFAFATCVWFATSGFASEIAHAGCCHDSPHKSGLQKSFCEP